MGGKRMSKGMGACRLGYLGFLHGFFHRLLQDGFVKMMAASFSRYSIYVVAGCGKYPLPSPLLTRVRVLAPKGIRQSNSAQASLKIALVLPLYQIKVLSELFFHCGGKHRVPVLVPFTRADYDLVAGEIDILDP